MSKEKKQCIELSITTQFSIYIELKDPFVVELIRMFPESKVKMEIPNIWYEKLEDIAFYCDIDGIEFVNQENIYDIMFIIEEYVQKRFREIILHGGAIAYKDMAIAFIQSRKSGKSTLIRALLADEEYEYISDDLLIYKEGKIAGVALPIRVRDKLENTINSTGFFVGSMKDESGETRNIYVPRNHFRTEFTPLKSIILPKYDSKAENEIIELTGSKKVMSILTNVKEYSDMGELYNQLVDMARRIKIYELRYNHIEFAEKEIRKLWNIRQAGEKHNTCVPNTELRTVI